MKTNYNKDALENARDFLRIADQFKLGKLVTESSHPVTANLSEVAKSDVPAALELLFEVDYDVIQKYAELVSSDIFDRVASTIIDSIRAGGRVFFTGCGATGRLSVQLEAIWRNFWKTYGDGCNSDIENRLFSVIAGGDYALIKSVEGFEDYIQFGARQIKDFGVNERDVVFAITEGGETSFVIGTAWESLKNGAKTYFVYNNPDDILRENIQRSRRIIDEPGIEKINLTTGPMAITGSTRMQATTIQLCFMLTVLEMAVHVLSETSMHKNIPAQFLETLEEIHTELSSEEVRLALAKLVELEETAYRAGKKINYFSDKLAIDVLTDTTERSPTFCIPPFKKHGDDEASESWAFLFVPQMDTPSAWNHLLKRELRAIEWMDSDLRQMVDVADLVRVSEAVRKISKEEIYRFKIGLDGLEDRIPSSGDCAIAILAGLEASSMLSPIGFVQGRLNDASYRGAKTGIVLLGTVQEIEKVADKIENELSVDVCVTIRLPQTGSLLHGAIHIATKILLNAFSTCVMVRMGRVMGNYMTWVVPSNLKLIDRAGRYIQNLTGLSYEDSINLLFDVIEYVKPRMKMDITYPPVVAMAVTRYKNGLSNEAAEAIIFQ